MSNKTKLTKKQAIEIIQPILTTENITNIKLCERIGISTAVFYKWCKSVDFLDKITEFREIFRLNSIEKLENNLEKLAFGEAKETTTEIKKDENNQTVWTKTRITKKAPDVKAIITLLKKYKAEYVKQDVIITVDNNKFLEDWNNQNKAIMDLVAKSQNDNR